MYYCPDCKKKFRQYHRHCPICGGRCYRGDNRAILLIVGVGVLFLLLIGLIILLCNGEKPEAGVGSEGSSSSVISQPSSSAAPSTSIPATSLPPATTVPPITTVPPVTTLPAPPAPPAFSGIGMYTRAELEALDSTQHGYGPGRTSGGKRAPYAESDQKKYGKYGGNFIAPDNGNIYLTFDCGYEYIATDADGNKYRVTEKILDTLKEKNVKAVFFITMPYAKGQADLVQRMIDEGHVVGNHSNNHPVMPEQTIDKMEYEVTSLHDYVLEHFGYKMTLFRPPTGAFSIQSLAVVQNLGYKNVHWSFAYGDYTTDKQPDVAESLELITNSAHSGAIYLLHAISTTNATLLGDAIDSFRAQNYNIALFQ